ncbi:hypothetical protein ENBRE01_1302 [Enteropsectra breve]|nr:hypothetical protein ENBRE01_1302 [Enteropsectra breve]
MRIYFWLHFLEILASKPKGGTDKYKRLLCTAVEGQIVINSSTKCTVCCRTFINSDPPAIPARDYMKRFSLRILKCPNAQCTATFSTICIIAQTLQMNVEKIDSSKMKRKDFLKMKRQLYHILKNELLDSDKKNQGHRNSNYWAYCPKCHYDFYFNPNEFLSYALWYYVNGAASYDRVLLLAADNLYVISYLLNENFSHNSLLQAQNFCKHAKKDALANLFRIACIIKFGSSELNVFNLAVSQLPQSKDNQLDAFEFGIFLCEKFRDNNSKYAMGEIIQSLYRRANMRDERVYKYLMQSILDDSSDNREFMGFISNMTLSEARYYCSMMDYAMVSHKNFPSFSEVADHLLGFVSASFSKNKSYDNQLQLTLLEKEALKNEFGRLRNLYKINMSVSKEPNSFVFSNRGNIKEQDFEFLFDWALKLAKENSKFKGIDVLFQVLWVRIFSLNISQYYNGNKVPREIGILYDFICEIAAGSFANNGTEQDNEFPDNKQLDSLWFVWDLVFVKFIAKTRVYLTINYKEAFNIMIKHMKNQEQRSNVCFLFVKEFFRTQDASFVDVVNMLYQNFLFDGCAEDLISGVVFALQHFETTEDDLRNLIIRKYIFGAERLYEIIKRALENTDFLNQNNAHAVHAYVRQEIEHKPSYWNKKKFYSQSDVDSDLWSILICAMGRGIGLFDVLPERHQNMIFKKMLLNKEYKDTGMIIFSIRDNNLIKRLNTDIVAEIVNQSPIGQDFSKAVAYWVKNKSNIIIAQYAELILVAIHPSFINNKRLMYFFMMIVDEERNKQAITKRNNSLNFTQSFCWPNNARKKEV